MPRPDETGSGILPQTTLPGLLIGYVGQRIPLGGGLNPALQGSLVLPLQFGAHADTNYIGGDGTPGGMFQVYSQIAAIGNKDLVLLGSATTGDIHIGNLAGGGGVLFIDTNIKVANWINLARGHGLQLLDGANNVVEEWPTAIATGIKYSAILLGVSGATNVWRLSVDADAARFYGGGVGAALIILPQQGVAGTGGNVYFQNNTVDGQTHFQIGLPAGVAATNFLKVTGAIAGAPPEMSSQGADVNVDTRLTPKGTGSLDLNYAAVALGGGAAPTFGTIGGGGPTAAAQNSWLRVKIAGVVSFIPVWR